MKKIKRVSKSLKLDKEQKRLLKEYVASHPTKVDVCEHIGIGRPTLDRLLIAGSGRGDTIEKVLSVILKEKTTA